MSFGRILLTALLAGALAVSACGLKGDPIRPGSEKDPKTQTTN
jgi:predicted small lipoprotein YifL